jgi:hypothetical protein
LEQAREPGTRRLLDRPDERAERDDLPGPKQEQPDEPPLEPQPAVAPRAPGSDSDRVDVGPVDGATGRGPPSGRTSSRWVVTTSRVSLTGTVSTRSSPSYRRVASAEAPLCQPCRGVRSTAT